MSENEHPYEPAENAAAEPVADTPQVEASDEPTAAPAPEPAQAEAAVESQDTQASDEVTYPAPEEHKATIEDEYAGEYVGNPGIEIPLDILEETPLPKVGALYLSNLERDELEVLRRLYYVSIFRNQKSRYEQVAAMKGDHNFVELQIEDRTIYVTEKERDDLGLMNSYYDSLRKGAGDGMFTGDVADEGWTNKPTLGDQVVAIGSVDKSDSKDPVARVRQQLRMTVGKGIPLWGSGFNMYIEGPGLLDQLTLETKILAEKSDMARESNGYVYSAPSVYMNGFVIDFILAHVTSTNLGITDPNQLQEMIALTDLEPMALAMAAAIYPDGYNLERPCLTTHGGCGAVITRKINLRRMLLVRRKRITDDQFQLMAKKSGHVDREIALNYQKSLRPDVSRLVHVKDDIYIRLWVPNLADYRRIASTWMETLDARARQLIASKSNEQERQVYLSRANNVALLLAFSHWIEGVVLRDPEKLDDEPQVVVSRSQINRDDPTSRHHIESELGHILEDMSGDNELVEKVVLGIEKFINDMTLATPIIPKTVCPKCGKPSTGDELSSHPHVVSINPIELFFTLLHHRLRQAGG